jgi:hypothetical protein
MLGCATARVGWPGIKWCFPIGLDLRGGRGCAYPEDRRGDGPGAVGCRESVAGSVWFTVRSGRQSSGRPHTVRSDCSHGNANLLRTGEAQSLVHIGVCRVVRDGIGLRIPSGSLAIRAGGIDLVRGSGKALVDYKVIQSLLMLRAYSSSLSGLACRNNSIDAAASTRPKTIIGMSPPSSIASASVLKASRMATMARVRAWFTLIPSNIGATKPLVRLRGGTARQISSFTL